MKIILNPGFPFLVLIKLIICYLQGIFQDCDKDDSGTLTEDEFVNGILKSEKGQ